MKIYISILRGINVGGQKIIKMKELKQLYEYLNFSEVHTYLQSGNVIFYSPEENVNELENAIRFEIKKNFNFDVPVIVLDVDIFQNIVLNNPFTNDSAKHISSLYVTFLSTATLSSNTAAITSKIQNNEEIAFAERAVYLYLPNGYAKTKLNNNLLENQLGVTATTRNWKTTTALFNTVQLLLRK